MKHLLPLLASVLLAPLAALHAADAPQPAAKPNIIFILADDLGWMDTSLYGSKFCETPNIERLAKRGMMFTQAYAANPLCSPTRSSIMTGLYPARVGITTPCCHEPAVRLDARLAAKAQPYQRALQVVSASRLKTEYYTLAEALHDAGYATGHFGKWHLGQEPYSPLQQGFDVDVPHYPGPGPAGSYVAPWHFSPELKFTGQPGEHIEDRMAGEAIQFIRANKDKPFFLNYWAFSVHAPFDAKADLIKKYGAKADPRNLAAEHPDKVQEYDALIARHLIDIKAVVPVKNPDYDPTARVPEPGKNPNRNKAAAAINKSAVKDIRQELEKAGDAM
jgi:arylsulfatase A-like enzyme